MNEHIDVYVNDWANGLQRVVARVSLTPEEEIAVDVIGDEEYRSVVLEPLTEPATGREISPTESPLEFFKQLPHALTGSYMGATSIHNGSCPFEGTDILRSQPVFHNELSF